MVMTTEKIKRLLEQYMTALEKDNYKPNRLTAENATGPYQLPGVMMKKRLWSTFSGCAPKRARSWQ
jgi:hypothetical protein